MNKQEFENRIGTTTTDATFEFASRVYMAAGEMTKDEFCADWKDNYVSESKIVSALTLEVESLQGALASANNCYERAEQSLRDFSSQMADFLIEQAQATGSFEIRAKAIKLIGEQEYLRRLILGNYDLWADDRKALDKILTK